MTRQPPRRVRTVGMVGVADRRGRLLMQERDERAPVDPNKWSMIGGGVEASESPVEAARRELAEEAGIPCDRLVALGRHVLSCVVHGHDVVDLYAGRTSASDDDVVCGEGPQRALVEPNVVAGST